jgi:hypothetical protein
MLAQVNSFCVLLNNVSAVSNAPLNVTFVCLVELIVAVSNVLAQLLAVLKLSMFISLVEIPFP